MSGLRCDLVRWYTPSVVLFLKIYDRSSFAALRTFPGFQVLLWWSTIRKGWPDWSDSRVRPTFWL